jgi:Sulfotransferase domain
MPEPSTITEELIPAAQRTWVRRYGTWQRFHRGVRKAGLPFLKTLPRYRNCVLVAGCQRSGTTMLTRLIATSAGFSRLAMTPDDELDAALTLAGLIDLPTDRRYCFQTTYLNERFPEYRVLEPQQRLIWVLRNPYSVVYSMLHNWQRFGLDELYEGCAIEPDSSPRLRRTRFLWPLGPSTLEKACLAYRAKVAQVLKIRTFLAPGQVFLVDYDALISEPQAWLPGIFEFAQTPYQQMYETLIRKDSMRKADRLSSGERQLIRRWALPVYEDCVALVRAPTPSSSSRHR